MGTGGHRSARLALSLALALTLFSAGGVAAAAPGGLVAQVQGPEATIGVSVAFDGQLLYYTNLNEPIIRRMTTQGVALAPLMTTVVDGINAFSYDATRDMFWAADATGQTIWLVAKTGVAVPKFTVTGKLVGDCDNGSQAGGPGFCDVLVDGLAYDATDDSIWYSPDASERVYRFGTDGTLLGYFDVNDPPEDMLPQCPPSLDRPHGNFNSGVGVGATVAYLTADGCGFFFSYAKSPTYLDPTQCPDPLNPFYCPGNKLDFFAYDGHRAEDLECDDVTFPQDVMWVRDEEDGFFRAYELPTGTCTFGGGVPIAPDKDRMTGGGHLPGVLPAGAEAHHGFMLHCDGSQKPNRLQINWDGNRFHLTALSMTQCSDDPLIPNEPGKSFDTISGNGTGRYNGVPGATAEWRFTDAGEPGTADTGELVVKDQNGVTVLVASGLLLPGSDPGGGNYQTHDA